MAPNIDRITNTNAAPASKEVLAVGLEQLRQNALDHADNAHEANPNDFDKRRAERMGASTAVAAERTGETSLTPDVRFFLTVGEMKQVDRGIEFIREADRAA